MLPGPAPCRCQTTAGVSAEIQGEWVSGGEQFPLLVKRATAFVFDKRTSQTDRPSARKDRRKKGRGRFRTAQGPHAKPAATGVPGRVPACASGRPHEAVEMPHTQGAGEPCALQTQLSLAVDRAPRPLDVHAKGQDHPYDNRAVTDDRAHRPRT